MSDRLSRTEVSKLSLDEYIDRYVSDDVKWRHRQGHHHHQHQHQRHHQHRGGSYWHRRRLYHRTHYFALSYQRQHQERLRLRLAQLKRRNLARNEQLQKQLELVKSAQPGQQESQLSDEEEIIDEANNNLLKPLNEYNYNLMVAMGILLPKSNDTKKFPVSETPHLVIVKVETEDPSSAKNETESELKNQEYNIKSEAENEYTAKNESFIEYENEYAVKNEYESKYTVKYEVDFELEDECTVKNELDSVEVEVEYTIEQKFESESEDCENAYDFKEKIEPEIEDEYNNARVESDIDIDIDIDENGDRDGDGDGDEYSTETIIAEIQQQIKEDIEMEDDINSDMLYIPNNLSINE